MNSTNMIPVVYCSSCDKVSYNHKQSCDHCGKTIPTSGHSNYSKLSPYSIQLDDNEALYVKVFYMDGTEELVELNHTADKHTLEFKKPVKQLHYTQSESESKTDLFTLPNK